MLHCCPFTQSWSEESYHIDPHSYIVFIHFTRWSIVHPWRAWAVLHGHGVCKGHIWSRWCSRSGPTRSQLVLSSSGPGEASPPQGPTQHRAAGASCTCWYFCLFYVHEVLTFCRVTAESGSFAQASWQPFSFCSCTNGSQVYSLLPSVSCWENPLEKQKDSFVLHTGP